MRVGIFDSGVGGLTVLKRMLEKHPNNEYIYLGDLKNNPYGEKNKQELTEITKKNIEFLLSKKVDIIFIACGTISSSVYYDIKDIYNVKIIDIISPTIKYINDIGYKNIGIWGTTFTINSHIFNNKLKSTIINSIPCSKLVPLIENDNTNIDKTVKEYINCLSNKEEILLLACTHYPIIRKKIEKYLSKNIKIIDMGEILANNIELKTSNKKIDLYFNSTNNNLQKNIKLILDNESEYTIIFKK